MLGLTRKPTTTKCVEVTYRVPVRFLGKAKRFLATLGAEESSDSVSWRDVFPKFNATVALRGARKKEGLTQKQLADYLKFLKRISRNWSMESAQSAKKWLIVSRKFWMWIIGLFYNCSRSLVSNRAQNAFMVPLVESFF